MVGGSGSFDYNPTVAATSGCASPSTDSPSAGSVISRGPWSDSVTVTSNS